MVKSTDALAGLRVLITRPEAQAGHWQQLLQGRGASTLRLPLLDIVPLTEADGPAWQAIKSRVMDISRYQHAIFVSQNAARYGLEWLDRYWPQLPLGLTCYAVGSATARALRGPLQQLGGRLISAGGSMNSEALLALPQLQDIEQQQVVIFRGQGGRPLLAETLTQRGARVDYCELYQRRLPDTDALPQLLAAEWGRSGDLVSVHSGETLANWCRLVESAGQSQWKQLPLLVPGERVAEQARMQGFTHVIQSENASDDTMLASLMAWQQHH